MKFASRIDKVPPYLFVEISRKIAEKKAQGIEVISFGIGDPDIPTPPNVVERLRETALDAPNHRYPESDGLPEFRQATANWYQRRFGISLDSDKGGAVPDRRERGHRPRRALLPGPRRHSLGAGPGLPRLFGRNLVRRRRMPLDAAAGRERLAAGPGRHTRGRGASGQADVAELPQQPDRRHRRSRLLREGGGVRRPTRHSRAARRFLYRSGLRRLQARQLPANAGRDGRGHGVSLAVQELQYDRLAAWRGRRQRRDDRRASWSSSPIWTPACPKPSSTWA